MSETGQLWILLGLVLVGAVVLLLVGRMFRLRRRERAIGAFLDAADALERDLHECRDRLRQMQTWLQTLPHADTTEASASLDIEHLTQNALRQLLQDRLWLKNHATTAPLAELEAARQKLDRARANLAEQMRRLESARVDLVQASDSAMRLSAEPNRRGNPTSRALSDSSR